MDKKALTVRNYEYWNQRAAGYSEVNREELAGVQRKNWSHLLDGEILKHFGKAPEQRNEIRILEIGAGPGFLSIILAELGYRVTAVDFSEEMIAEAGRNAGELASAICFQKEDAMRLTFATESFDVVLSRNLTWNLPDPKTAYAEWIRVLKTGGLMLVFDANWYDFLVDDEKKAAFDRDRENVAARGMEDYNIGENFEVMDAIAMQLPLTGERRPAWDVQALTGLGISEVQTIEDIGSIVYSEKEKVNYASTPLFMIKGVK